MQQPKLTFIHGFMGHPSDWDEVRAALPEIETFAVEIEAAPDWSSSIKQLTKAVSTEAVSIEADSTEAVSFRSILVGYSMGARLALGMALEHPDRFDGLVFISGNPGLESQEAREQRRSADEQVARQIEEGQLDSFLEQWYQSKVFAGLPEEVRRQEIKRKLSRSSCDWPGILRTNSVAQQPNYWTRLDELSMPVVVVAGERDEKYKEIATRFGKEILPSNVTQKIIPDCGHVVHREQPETLVKIIRVLLSQSQPEA